MPRQGTLEEYETIARRLKCLSGLSGEISGKDHATCGVTDWRRSMLGALRLMAVGFAVLTVVYICLSLYSRAVRRAKLEAEWDRDQGPGERDGFVDQGLEEYDGSLRRKLILGVYVVPLCLVALIIYLTNFA
jgi:hypothetical protein